VQNLPLGMHISARHEAAWADCGGLVSQASRIQTAANVPQPGYTGRPEGAGENMNHVVGRIQERYGVAKAEAEK